VGVDRKAYRWLARIRDSKLLAAEEREELRPLIEAWLAAEQGAFGLGWASVEEIDRINIYHASHLAMRRALDAALGQRQAQAAQDPVGQVQALIDGNALPRDLPCPAEAIVKGDLQCLSIAAASILAKVARDRYMAELEQTHPGYGFGQHKGYGTPEHIRALEALGVCPAHRRSFAPVAQRLLRMEVHVEQGSLF
jgi:ribonuclease HII